MADNEKLQMVLKIVTEVAEREDDPLYPGMYWDQAEWVRPVLIDIEEAPFQDNICGTAMCFAGWTMFLEGYTRYDDFTGQLIDPETGDEFNNWQAGEKAADVLGLTDGQANQLFTGDNTLEDLHFIVGAIIAERERSNG